MINVNGVDISYIEVINKTITPSTYKSYSNWNAQSLIPITLKEGRFEYGIMQLELLSRGITEDKVEDYTSQFLKEVCESVIKFGNFYYKVRLNNITVQDVTKDSLNNNYYQLLNVQFIIDIKYKDSVKETLNPSGITQITNKGNKDIPCILTITASQSMIDLVIQGLTDEPFTVKNLNSGDVLVIDGENQTISIDGVNKFNDVENFWEFPRIKVGSNSISFSKSYFTANISYKEIFV